MFNKIKKFAKSIKTSVYIFLNFIILLLLFISFGKIEWLKSIEIQDISAYANTISTIVGENLKYLQTTTVKVLLFALLIIANTLWIIKIISKDKILLIRHNSFSNAIEGYNSKAFKKKKMIIENINITKEIEKDKYEALRLQDQFVKRIKDKLSPECELSYCGIAHIPFISRMGYQIGDENNVLLLHKNRNNDSVFDKIESNADYSNKIEHEYVPGIMDGNSLLVTVSTTFSIEPTDISQFYTKVSHILKFNLQKKGFDVLNNMPLMEVAKNDILTKIRDIVKRKNISIIHLVMATSSDFAFFLSQGFSEMHDPKIIVYHYSKQSDIKYPWGISLMDKPEESIIE